MENNVPALPHGCDARRLPCLDISTASRQQLCKCMKRRPELSIFGALLSSGSPNRWLDLVQIWRSRPGLITPHARTHVEPSGRGIGMGIVVLLLPLPCPLCIQIWNQQNACEDNIISGTKRGSGLTPGGGGFPLLVVELTNPQPHTISHYPHLASRTRRAS